MAESSLFWYGKISQGAPGDAGGYTDVQFTEFVKAVFEFRTGVLSGLRVTPTAPASKAIQVSAGVGVVRGRVYTNDGATNLPVSDNTSGSTRIDCVVVRVDYAGQTARLAILEGTPGAGVPALTQNEGVIWEMSLAQISLASGFATITEGDITREREWARDNAPGDTKFSFQRRSQEPDWLLCDGRAVSRTTYADLFDAIGTDHGVGDGSTTFNIPDFRGRSPAGMDNMGTARGSANVNTSAGADILGGTDGAETKTLSDNNLPPNIYANRGGPSLLASGTAWYINQIGASAPLNVVSPQLFGYIYIKT